MLTENEKTLRKDYFKEFLNWFWLRPENALLLAIRAERYHSTLKYFGKGDKTVDISCGDGVFSFITFGGSLSSKTDMFRSVKTEKTFRKEDYDAFDHFDESDYLVEIEDKPDRSYEYGTDWKENLLKKADKLDFYNKLIQHDNNNSLPFPDEEMKYVYSNSTYWVDNFKFHLKDLVRITEEGGHIILEIKVKSIKNHTSRNYLPSMGEKFHEIIDAGRLSTWKGLRSKEKVIKILKNIEGVEIKRIEPIYGGLPVKIWDIGLRPIFNPLVKMANNLSPEKRVKVKEEWNQIFYNMFEHLLTNYEATDDTAVEYLIVLEKNNS